MPGHGVIPIRTQAGNVVPPQCPAASTKNRCRNKYAVVGTGLAGPRLCPAPPIRSHLTELLRDALGGHLLLSHPYGTLRILTSRPASTTTRNQHGLLAAPGSVRRRVDPKTGEPMPGQIVGSLHGWTRTGSGSSTTTGSPWCRPQRKSGRPTWHQNPRPSTSTKAREAGTTPQIPDRG